ncbi:T9SS type B sorting domain-containing protein [Winogradskyella sediminis]|uniref:Gliding motility-associated C-terminal domain-containing protein n=1 Tax=Winogradskyella sediminis TaxID=1382466 RepID=A0A1H1UU19_9FLAO|nr:T9SS type B sorting domain-containing protein [Winogradskyella sediminis]SDS75761.1 gliding motility-associated C-terminal domain-containing protein [Winogradskyella sediminis]
MKYLFTIIPLLFSSLLLAQDITMQTATVNQCGGVFYDSGGEFANYSDDEDFVLTICPENPGEKVQLDFTFFSTQLNSDVMTIFNGDSVAADAFGDFSGPNSPGFVVATGDNPSGCITIQFVSNDSGTINGWAADISCLTPCQTINSEIVSASPAPNGDNYIRVCPNEEITLTGDGDFSVDGTGATYEWDLGDGNTVAGQTATFSYPDPGVYIVNLNIRDANTSVDPLGCKNDNLINQVIQVATEPDFTGTEAANTTLCFGESTDITGVVEAVEFINDCTPPVSGVTFLPDGNGVTYETSITVDCYDSAQNMDDISQLVSICLTMEHSFLGDLDIEIISPNGQVVRMHDQGGSGANLGEPWATASVDGESSNTTPGRGFQYCFVPDNSFPTLAGGVQSGGVFVSGNGPGTYTDSYVPAGNYSSIEPLEGLEGSPLNGDWTIRVVDNLGADNGHIFAWSIEFDPNLQPPELSFEPVITSEAWDTDPTITNTAGNVITVQPSTAGQFCYTYRVTDDFGCEYTEEVCIDVLPEFITESPNSLYVCDTGVPPYIFNLESNTPVVLASATNASDLVVTYHNSLTDAEGDLSAIPDSGNYTGTDGETIYVRIEYSNSGCFDVFPFVLNVSGQPTINPVSDLELCDDESNDGFETFDLSSQTLGILGVQPESDYTVTYHLSFNDADSGDNALPSDYTNTVNSQPIFVRVASSGDSNCYNASSTALFNLVVNPRALATTPDNMVVCDDVSNDGFETFDLSSQEAAILDGQDPTVYNVSFHSSEDDAINNVDNLPTSYTNNTANLETIYVRVEDPAFPSCYSTTSFDLVVNELPIVTSVTPLQVCDDDTDGFAAFPLLTKESELLNGQTGVSISFHENLVGAETDSAEIFDGYINSTVNSETIFVRLENTTTNCYNVTSLTLEVLENPVANSTTPLEVCDDNADGIAVFDLSIKDSEIVGAQSGMTVLYYENLADAEAGGTPLPVNYTNTQAGAQEIIARIENVATGCYATTPLQLIVNPKPLILDVSDFELCDENAPGDEEEAFDLTTKTSEILGTQINVSVSYFANPSDAASGTNAIMAPYTNISNPQSITAVLTNTLTGCTSSLSFDIIVNPLPSLVSPTALEVCDDGTPDGLTEMDLSLKNTEITGNNPSYSVSYYENLTDAESEVNPLPTLYTNTSNGQVIYARVEDTTTGCFDTTTLELIVQQAPIAFTPQPLRYCDPDNDGLGVFTLTDLDNEITGGASGLEVTYHETEINADNGVDAIDTTVDYNNIVQDYQIIYARVESATIATDCATIVPVDLIVEPTPQLIEPSALEACDDISADGFATFDLTSKAPELLNGQDPLQYLVSYYETEANAIADNNAISNPMAYTNTDDFNQIIWIRVEDDTTVAGCYKITSLELIVNPLPVLVTPAPLERCDVDNPGDEQEGFILEEANEDILNGQTGITLTYYETLSDAENATNPITSPYVNTSNAQTIFVRAENDNTSCYNTVTVTLRVNPVPSPEPNPTAIEVCDDDNDGFAEFDLEQRTIEVINGEPNVAISYHETQTDAENGENAITGLYTNIVANSQIIYVRSENTITGCYSLTEQTLELIVLPSPEVPTSIDSYVLCDSDDNGITQFDLTTKDAEILNGQDPLEVELTYHVSELDAANGDNPIVNVGSFTNTVNPQTIYVRLFNPTTGCQDTGMFELEVNLPPVAVQPTQLSKCDDLGETPGDEFTIFDLTVKDTEITGGNASWSVAYYETNADAQSQTNAIPDPTQYTNTSVDGLNANPQTLYVVVTDEDTGCVDFTTLTIRVMPNPTPTPSDLLPNIELCDDFNTGDEVEVFDLTENEALILNGEAGVTASYYESLEDANAATNAIPDPTQYTNTELSEQEIYVRVTNDLTDCYALVDFTIIVHPLPEVIAVTDFIQCELFTDGFDSFDLTSKDGEVLNGQDPTQFVVSYHDNLADAEAGINGLVSPYTNISNPQQIFVTITNTVTGCSISTQSFNIEVQEAAQANPNMDPIVYETCDDNMETDGNPSNDSAQFDLTTRDIEVLDGQDAANYVVSYYETQEEADLKVNPLPTLYENIVNPQIIYARVDNDTPDGTGVDTSICYAVAALTLQVNPLPEFNLEDSYTLCLNTNGSEVLDPLVIDTGLSATDYSFEWSYEGTIIAGATGPSIMPSQGGSYSVLVTDMSTSTETNCTNMDTTTVIESAPPSLSVELLTQAFADNHVLEAVANGIGVYEYSLDGGPWQDEGVFTNVSTGEHEITARDKNGCGITTESIFVIDYPLYFTPNGDGNNDTWNIEGIGSNAIIYIFDRYGKLLKQISPEGDGWNGTYNSKAMPTSDYWFTVEYDEPSTGQRKEFKAHFALKR